MSNLHPVGRERVAMLLPQFADANYRQTWSYAASAAQRLGARSEWAEICSERETIGLANVRVKTLPLGLGGVAFVSGGPLVRSRTRAAVASDVAAFEASIAALAEEYIRRRGLKLRIHAAVGAPDWNFAQRNVLSAHGFVVVESAAIYRTLIKSIRGTDDELRKSLAQKWRNQLNAADRQGLTIECGDDIRLFERFEILFRHTRDQKGFFVDLDLDFFRAVRQDSKEAEPKPWITLIRSGGLDVSGHLGMYMGDTAVYLLGGTNDEGRRVKAAYLAQWEAMRHARAQSCVWYDTGGIDPLGNPGVFHFKAGLAGVDVTAAGPVERAPRGPRAFITKVAEQAYRRMRARPRSS